MLHDRQRGQDGERVARLLEGGAPAQLRPAREERRGDAEGPARRGHARGDHALRDSRHAGLRPGRGGDPDHAHDHRRGAEREPLGHADPVDHRRRREEHEDAQQRVDPGQLERPKREIGGRAQAGRLQADIERRQIARAQAGDLADCADRRRHEQRPQGMQARAVVEVRPARADGAHGARGIGIEPQVDPAAEPGELELAKLMSGDRGARRPDDQHNDELRDEAPGRREAQDLRDRLPAAPELALHQALGALQSGHVHARRRLRSSARGCDARRRPRSLGERFPAGD